MTPCLSRCLVLLFCLSVAGVARAQIPGYSSKQFRLEQIDEHHWRLTDQVELENAEVKGQKFYANTVDIHTDTNVLEATGNVLYETPTARIAAERVLFNTKTGTGTFFAASGMASIGDRADKSMFGGIEPDVYFYGTLVEKTGEDRYRVTKGGFTTCVQPTPRWEMTAGSFSINVGDYAILRNAVMHVKDVPVFYLPILYYPIQDDGRSTGFLLPTYGRSTYQGSSVSNAFFWAITRSQDLTVMHDWFTSRGQGYGTEYRWIRSATANGNIKAYRLSQKAGTLNGVQLPESQSVLVNGSVNQSLPLGLTGRARIDYSSQLTLNQFYSRDLYNATQGTSSATGNVSGSWSFVNTSLTASRNENFFNADQSIVSGSLPSLTASVSSRRIWRLPVFFALQSEATRVLYVQKNGAQEIDDSLNKFDLTPTLRAPVSNLPFLNATLNLSYRSTTYSASKDLATGRRVEDPYTRNYAEMRADITGPVFSRVYTPNNFLADRLKHVIEPAFSLQRTTAIEGQDRVLLLGSSYDRVIGGVTRMTYGLTNRVLVRKAPKRSATSSTAAPPAAASAPRELLTAAVTQSYYSDQRASSFDPTYSSSYADSGTVRPPSNYSPVALNVRSQASQTLATTLRMEYDWPTKKMLSISTGGNFATPTTSVSLAWSRSLSAFYPTNALNASSRLNLLDGRVSGDYQIAWDIQRQTVIRQGIVGSYNAQCCGIVMEYQEYNFGNFGGGSSLPKDRRFNLGFTLAGVGTFSNFFGNFGGGGAGR
ncbi:MAG: LPS-assembly protein LptD [Acidobacteria bacterium]|nr:LPS-assembly protein LptD [Acidobacteriota bacterium]